MSNMFLLSSQTIFWEPAVFTVILQVGSVRPTE